MKRKFCRWTILDSVIICIAFIQHELKVKSNTTTQKSASYFDLYLAIDGGKLKIKHHYKRDDYTLPIVKFISSNIPAASAYTVYISQVIALFSQVIALCPIQRCSEQSSAADTKTTKTRLRCPYKNDTVVMTNRLIATKHPCIFSLFEDFSFIDQR